MGQLRFLGSYDTVTGSRILFSYHNKKILIDCGLFQGVRELRERNWQTDTSLAQSIDFVLLTHAHLDHSGFLPRFYRDGFRGEVFCSEGTFDLAKILLTDAAHIEEENMQHANESGYSHHKPALPLFTIKEANQVLQQFRPKPRDQWFELFPGLSFRFVRSGHIVGSSFIQLNVAFDHGSKIITFSGDLGHQRSPILAGPSVLQETDVLVLESTYGDRVHPAQHPKDFLKQFINKIYNRSGVLVIPAFAVGRCQEILYLIKQLEDTGAIPKQPVLLDSPMASKATEVFIRHKEDHNEVSFVGGETEILPARFQAINTREDSMRACLRPGPLIVISASGMLSGGRVLHHLKCRISDERNAVLFTGYQAEGTKGRFLQELPNGESLRIHHTEYPVHAEIASLDQLSAHADSKEILSWFGSIVKKPKLTILNHGSASSQKALAESLKKTFAVQVDITCEKQVFSI